MGDSNSLTFRIGRNTKGVTHLRIRLDPSDTYTVEALSSRSVPVKVKFSQSFVDADAICQTIKTATGLYTHL